MTFFYKLIDKKILGMYLEFGDDWKSSIARISIESIKESTIKFESKKFFTDRNSINDQLLSDLQASFNDKAVGAIEVCKFYN